MSNNIMEQVNQLNRPFERHIFYHYDNPECYINNTVSYIASGVCKGEHVMLVENERNYRLILEQLKTKVDKNQLDKVHFINNFDFYYAHGNFHPETILSVFSQNIEAYLGDNKKVRTWGHIEWRDIEEISGCIEEYEKGVDKMVDDHSLVSVCAYDASRITPSLKATLMRCHKVMLTDDEIIYLSKDAV
ncbi:MEDS domain-containing protein [Mesobacillus harenae]|uniref:MEDS domain-containing protein n=1 Tax=Mesobacillus harenae TaxID=2213203 RepID=UPI0015812B38|nr:MEDS domain-containing protein [Mesobacillus harenae]